MIFYIVTKFERIFAINRYGRGWGRRRPPPFVRYLFHVKHAHKFYTKNTKHIYKTREKDENM